MANIRIVKENNEYTVTVDEYPQISFSEHTMEKARNKAVRLVKKQIAKEVPATTPKEKEEPRKVKLGFAA